MKRLLHDQPIPEELRGAIIALGNFDGFHLGHQAVVGRAVQRGAHERRPVIVATFDPHPVRHFKPDTPPFRLTTLDQREELFAHAGADAMLVFNFGAELASTSAEDFVVKLLGEHLGAAGVVTGEDFTFGKGRGGNVDVLREVGAQNGIIAETVGAVMLDGVRISSGRIREALQSGDPHTATHQLTRPFAIRADVIHGPLDHFGVHVHRVPPVVSSHVTEGVVEDREQPRLQVRAALELVRGSKRFQVRLLDQVLGILCPPRQPQRRPVEAVDVGQGLGRERLILTRR